MFTLVHHGAASPNDVPQTNPKGCECSALVVSVLPAVYTGSHNGGADRVTTDPRDLEVREDMPRSHNWIGTGCGARAGISRGRSFSNLAPDWLKNPGGIHIFDRSLINSIGTKYLVSGRAWQYMFDTLDHT